MHRVHRSCSSEEIIFKTLMKKMMFELKFNLELNFFFLHFEVSLKIIGGKKSLTCPIIAMAQFLFKDQ